MEKEKKMEVDLSTLRETQKVSRRDSRNKKFRNRGADNFKRMKNAKEFDARRDRKQTHQYFNELI
jgi:hypothetical protein